MSHKSECINGSESLIEFREGRNPLLIAVKESSEGIWLKTTSDKKDGLRHGYTKKEEQEQIHEGRKQTSVRGAKREMRMPLHQVSKEP